MFRMMALAFAGLLLITAYYGGTPESLAYHPTTQPIAGAAEDIEALATEQTAPHGFHQPGGVIQGVVVDEDGSPIPGLPLVWRYVSQDSTHFLLCGYGYPGLAAHETLTSARGTFTIGPLPPGKGTLRVLSEDIAIGDAVREGCTKLISVRSGLTASSVRMVASLVPRNRRLSGVLVDELGVPLSRIPITLKRSVIFTGKKYEQKVLTSAEGEFGFVAPHPGGPITLDWPAPAGGVNLRELRLLGQQGLRLVSH